MDLIARIEQALSTQHVDPTEFEKCATSLLQSRYPGLSAVEGGHDFGRDADIYFDFDEVSGRKPIGRLMATTQADVRANVANGMRRMQEEGLNADVVVVATTRHLSAQQRRSIEQVVLDHGVGITEIYGRHWFVGRLTKEAIWRERLLGVTGELEALVTAPVSILEQATTTPDLVGREGIINELGSLLESTTDILIFGSPGSGKTRVLTELGPGVFFLETSNESRVVDDLRGYEPRAVVVDDAHDRLDEIALLRRARSQVGLKFAVIAATWPDQEPAVSSAFSQVQSLELPLLEREPMDQMVRSIGVNGYRARSLILEQAEGRPGWALALVEGLLRGESQELLTGVALLKQVEGFLRRSTHSMVALDTLACSAALDPLAEEDLTPLAEVVGVPLAELLDVLRRNAKNGLLDRTRDGWRIQPSLRTPLVAQWFFSDERVRPWETLQHRFEHRIDRLNHHLVEAARISNTARTVADEWFNSLRNPLSWGDQTWENVSVYARIDADRSAAASELAREVLGGERPTTSYEALGGQITLDPVGDAARRQVTLSARQYLIPAAIQGLLDISIDDDRPRPQNPDHPLRILCDLATNLDPDFGTSIEIRRRVLLPALDWLLAGESDRRWEVFAELICCVFSVRVSGAWSDPGKPHTLTWSDGVESAGHLEELSTLWSSVEPILGRLTPEKTLKQIPSQAVVHLLNLLESWLRLAARRLPEKDQISDQQAEIGGKGAERILTVLKPHINSRPGLVFRAHKILRDQRRPDLDDFEVDPGLVSLLGERDPWEDRDYEAHRKARGVQLEALAVKLASLGPREGISRLNELEGEGILAGKHSADSGWLASLMKPHFDDAREWFDVALINDCWSVLGASLEIILEGPEEPEDLERISKALSDPRLRAVVISAVLSHDVETPAVNLVLNELTSADVRQLEWLLLRREESDPVLYRLLTHRDPCIAAGTAVSFAVGTNHGPSLPPEWMDEWKSAIVDMRVNELKDQMLEWRAGELLGHLALVNPKVFESWFIARLDELLEKGYLHAPEPHECEVHLRHLPEPSRERIIRRCAGVPWVGENLLAHLLGDDPDFIMRLLEEGTISTRDLLDALLGQRGPLLETVGPVLVERGVPPEQIAAEGDFDSSGWGPESSAIESRLDYYRSLLSSESEELRLIGRAGVARLEERLKMEQQREHERRVRGEL